MEYNREKRKVYSWLNPLRFLCQLILTKSEFSNLLKFSLWKFHFCRGCFYFFCRYERSPERYPFRAFDTGKIETEIFPYRAADCGRIRKPKRLSETDAFFESGMPGFSCRMGHPKPREKRLPFRGKGGDRAAGETGWTGFRKGPTST